jgi:hypothetical protein
VATDEGEVFGGYCLKHQAFQTDGVPLTLDNLQLPLSLGVVDPHYAHVSVALLFDALGRNDLLYCLGMGSQDSKLVKLLTAAGWQHRVTPFYFRVLAANRFARNIRLPAQRAGLQRALRWAGALGLAGVGLWLVNTLKGTGRAPRTSATTEVVPRFDATLDELYAQSSGTYALIGDRCAATLNAWYPEANPTFLRLVVKNAGVVVGWAVLLDTAMRDHKYFGNLRVGTLADGFARPGQAGIVVAAADRFLRERGVDLIVSNQLHAEWGEALAQAGYRLGPSNYFFYYSGELAERLAARPDWERRIHLNRGDGDGPIHL